MKVMQRIAVWHGTNEALERLRRAVENNCECLTLDGVPDRTCEPHRMLSDQNVLDHFVFVWKARMAYYHGEFDPEAEWW